MTSGYSVGENEGTGGDFSAVGSPTIDTTNGTEATSGVGKGGMVWYRRRDGAENNNVEDTERGIRKQIYTDATNAQGTATIYGLQAFNSNGFFAGINTSGGKYVSWTFRKAEKFFDIQTWTGNGTAGRTISHDLGSDPGMVIIKRTDSSQNWIVHHRSLNATKYLALNLSNGEINGSDITATSSTNVTLSDSFTVNGGSATYVGYFFAHNNNDGTFGP